jgi:hypothetical protein
LLPPPEGARPLNAWPGEMDDEARNGGNRRPRLSRADAGEEPGGGGRKSRSAAGGGGGEREDAVGMRVQPGVKEEIRLIYDCRRQVF